MPPYPWMFEIILLIADLFTPTKFVSSGNWKFFVEFENDPTKSNFGGGLSLRLCKFVTGKLEVKLIHAIEHPFTHTLYFTRLGPKTVEKTGVFKDGMHWVQDAKGAYGVPYMPVNYPAGFVPISGETQLGDLNEWKVNPKLRPTASKVVNVAAKAPIAAADATAMVQVVVRARFQAANYLFTTQYTFFHDGSIEVGVGLSGVTLPDNFEKLLPLVESQAKVHLHNLYFAVIAELPSVDDQVPLQAIDQLVLSLNNGAGSFLPAFDFIPVPDQKVIDAHATGTQALRWRGAKAQSALPGTLGWYVENQKLALLLEAHQEVHVDHVVCDFDYSVQRYPFDKMNSAPEAVVGEIVKNVGLAETKALEQSPGGPVPLIWVALRHLHLPEHPDAFGMVERLVSFRLRPVGV